MDKSHNITVGLDGTFKPQGKFHTNSTPADVITLVDGIVKSNKNQIGIYFHGGLVNYKDGVEAGKEVNQAMLNENLYPVSFVWKTGLGETLRDNLSTIKNTKIFKKLLRYVIQKAGSKLGFQLGAKGAGRINDQEIEAELLKEFPFHDMFVKEDARSGMANIANNAQYLEDEIYAEIEQDLNADLELQELLKDINIDETLIDVEKLELTTTENDGKRGFLSLGKVVWSLAKISIRVIKRFLNGRDHEPYATFFEEILRELYIADFGEWVWGGMKLKSDLMWDSNVDRNGQDLHVGRHFLDELSKSATEPLTIHLVGHSAGSIAICNLLRQFQGEFNNLKIGKVAFMAPACRSDLFHQEIVQHPNRYEHFRMFTMKDEHELKDALVNSFAKLYPSSLLYLISGILESNDVEGEKVSSFDEPILGMSRYLDRDFYQDLYPIMLPIKEFLNVNNRLVLSPVSDQPQGLNSLALDHGDFDNESQTLASITHFLKED